jgi:hypothetical protein
MDKNQFDMIIIDGPWSKIAPNARYGAVEYILSNNRNSNLIVYVDDIDRADELAIFNDLKIKHNIAITGEISLDGFITEIGGLDLKILGAIKAGVKEILFPVENKKDYDKFFDKYKDDELIKDIKFYPVSQIQQVFEIVFE